MSGNDARQEIRLPADLKRWANDFVVENNTTFSALVVRFLTKLKQAEDAKHGDSDGG